jgi:hypothetical protein
MKDLDIIKCKINNLLSMGGSCFGSRNTKVNIPEDSNNSDKEEVKKVEEKIKEKKVPPITKDENLAKKEKKPSDFDTKRNENTNVSNNNIVNGSITNTLKAPEANKSDMNTPNKSPNIKKPILSNPTNPMVFNFQSKFKSKEVGKGNIKEDTEKKEKNDSVKDINVDKYMQMVEQIDKMKR